MNLVLRIAVIWTRQNTSRMRQQTQRVLHGGELPGGWRCVCVGGGKSVEKKDKEKKQRNPRLLKHKYDDDDQRKSFILSLFPVRQQVGNLMKAQTWPHSPRSSKTIFTASISAAAAAAETSTNLIMCWAVMEKTHLDLEAASDKTLFSHCFPSE